VEHNGQYTNRFLQKIQYLTTLSSEEEETLQFFITMAREVNAQTELISQGEAYRCGYMLHTGWAIRAKTLRDGRRQILNFVLPGDVVGLAAPFFAVADYSVTTIGPTNVTEMTFTRFTEIFHTQPRLGAALCWQLAQEEAIISEHLVNIGRRDAYTRVGHLFAELYWRLDTVGLVQDSTYTLPLSQTILADALGLSFVHISRTLRRLRQDGLVHVDGSQVVLRDREALERRIDFEHAYLYTACTPVWLRRYRARERSTP
jgi:CRP-like cAMP-binding protein